ncbi:MAG: hypothetical protein IT435_13745 [Phycisphaerales bacterium]|nr:hypothetical protein [Phycisphaerales bacterium]
MKRSTLLAIGAGMSVMGSIGLSSAAFAQPQTAPAAEKAAPRAAELLAKAAAYLRSKQDASTGGWKTEGDGPKFPAITALAVMGLMDSQASAGSDVALQRAERYILSMQKPDGGIYDSSVQTYNTSICISALSRLNNPNSKEAIKKAVDFLKTLQFGEGAVEYPEMKETAKPVDKDHAFYGGLGYGGGARPDLSNLAWMIEALHDAGIESDDVAFKRAMVFLQRTQMLEKTPEGTVVNDMPYARGSRQGGFIYSTSPNRDKIGQGQSMAAEIEETMDDGTNVSRLRCYGSMTYSGFKSYVYADLKRDDPRVLAAMKWILDNYTVNENPGMGNSGLYYYYVVMSKALAAWGEKELPVRIGEVQKSGQPSKAGDVVRSAHWARDLVARLAELQEPDGSFKSVDKRWMESDPILITAYAMIALREAERFE